MIYRQWMLSALTPWLIRGHTRDLLSTPSFGEDAISITAISLELCSLVSCSPGKGILHDNTGGSACAVPAPAWERVSLQTAKMQERDISSGEEQRWFYARKNAKSYQLIQRAGSVIRISTCIWLEYVESINSYMAGRTWRVSNDLWLRYINGFNWSIPWSMWRASTLLLLVVGMGRAWTSPYWKQSLKNVYCCTAGSMSRVFPDLSRKYVKSFNSGTLWYVPAGL